MKEKVLTEYQFQLLNKIKDGDYLYDNHKRLEGLTTVLVELLSKDTELLYSIIDGYFGDERVINAITDYLNSQDQEEENTVCEGCGKTITSRFMQEEVMQRRSEELSKLKTKE